MLAIFTLDNNSNTSDVRFFLVQYPIIEYKCLTYKKIMYKINNKIGFTINVFPGYVTYSDESGSYSFERIKITNSQPYIVPDGYLFRYKELCRDYVNEYGEPIDWTKCKYIGIKEKSVWIFTGYYDYAYSYWSPRQVKKIILGSLNVTKTGKVCVKNSEKIRKSMPRMYHGGYTTIPAFEKLYYNNGVIIVEMYGNHSYYYP